MVPAERLGSAVDCLYAGGQGQLRGLKGSEKGASERSKRDSASEAWPSEVSRFLGPTSRLPQSWCPSRGSSAPPETLFAQGMRAALSTDPPPSPILEPRVPSRSAAMAATTSQPAVSADSQGSGKTSGPEPALSLSLCRASSGSSRPRPGNASHGAGHRLRVSDSGVRGSAPSPPRRFFLAAIVPAAMSTSRRPGAAPASGFAARPAVRRCAGSSSGNGSGGSDPFRCAISTVAGPPAGRELLGPYRLRPRHRDTN